MTPRRSRRWLGAGFHSSDRGSAPIEFIFASVILLVPLIYLVVALAQVQAASFAATATAIDASRLAATHPSTASSRADALARLHFADHGLQTSSYTITTECSGPCDEAGTIVTARVEARVSLPGIPNLFGSEDFAKVRISAHHADVVAQDAAASTGKSGRIP